MWNAIGLVQDLNSCRRVHSYDDNHYTTGTCINPLVTVPRAPITISDTVTFILHILKKIPSKVVVPILLFAFFQFYSVVSWDSKVHNSISSLFLVDYYLVWSSGRDYVIRLYLKIPEEIQSPTNFLLHNSFLNSFDKVFNNFLQSSWKNSENSSHLDRFLSGILSENKKLILKDFISEDIDEGKFEI